MMKRVLLAGSFDPLTMGHWDLIQRAAKLCEKLYIAVAENSGKGQGCFSVEERLSMLKTATQEMQNVEVVSFSGLVVDCAKAFHIDALVRGVRNGGDLDYEMQMAQANRQMTGIETIFLFPSASCAHISGTLIREIASHGRRLHGFVPDVIESIVWNKWKMNKIGRI